MRYSQLVGKTKKEAPHDETSKNAQLLIRAGYIEKEMAGTYAFLPLGLITLRKIMQVIREEMNAIGAQEVYLSSLQSPEVWKKSGRWDDHVVDVWFKSKLKNDVEVGLAWSHEEPLTQIMTKHVQSYKDLPIYAYQFSTKLRNELRAKNGLLRTREFIMKDLYSFDVDEAALENFYEKCKQAYFKIFDRLGIGDRTYLTFASGGAFSKYSHEFQTVCEAGEDTIYLDEAKKLAINKEVYFEDSLKELGVNKSDLKEVAAIEVGNIFSLKTRYSEPLGLNYTDENGAQKPVHMGSYGIGPARVMATIVELLSDEKGIVWPEALAPFKFHLVGLDLQDEAIKTQAENVYNHLTADGIEVLYDDRVDVAAGQKFADADLLGNPYRLVVSKKSGDKVEVKNRKSSETKLVTVEELSKL
ncbi:MAG TPA: aminoacyl--tRNA ligase-related protein [Candidatus Saccharimonadales bacterium]|nr:aminoacyl--tRNA ligase-related protein [Candidatus Saccharimonadales bacterium]